MTAIAAQIASVRSLVDGSMRISIDLPIESTPLWVLRIGQAVALAPLDPDVIDKSGAVQTQEGQPAITAEPSGAPRHRFGQEAKALRLSGFCGVPEVWKALGPDKDFLLWLRTRPCAASHLGNCAGDVVAAHVRRIANGAGVGIKPEYSAIPLCHFHHSLQHQKGEESLWQKETSDRLRIDALYDWSWQRLRKIFEVDHIYDLEPARLYSWATLHGVESQLPACYRG